MIDRKKFFDCVRQQPFGGKLTAGQVGGMTAILDEWERRRLTDLRWLACMLGTTKWETRHTMQPIVEQDNPARTYLRSKKYWPWIGRGYVQLTWERNYQRFRARVLKLFKVDIVADMEAARRKDVAAFIMFEGMINGEFTGKKLADYFTATQSNWISSRRIINGTDKAATIAEISKQFYAALVTASA